jgi:hypothetical protein
MLAWDQPVFFKELVTWIHVNSSMHWFCILGSSSLAHAAYRSICSPRLRRSCITLCWFPRLGCVHCLATSSGAFLSLKLVKWVTTLLRIISRLIILCLVHKLGEGIALPNGGCWCNVYRKFSRIYKTVWPLELTYLSLRWYNDLGPWNRLSCHSMLIILYWGRILICDKTISRLWLFVELSVLILDFT